MGPGRWRTAEKRQTLSAHRIFHKTRKAEVSSVKWRPSRFSNRTDNRTRTRYVFYRHDFFMGPSYASAATSLQPIRRIRVAFGELPSLECLELGSFRSLYHAALGHSAHSGKLAPAAAAENAGQHRGRSCAPRSAAAEREFCEPVMGCWR